MATDKIVYKSLGIMSGTSLDGLDMAICRFRYEDEKWFSEILKAKEISYPKELLEKIKRSFTSSAVELAELNNTLGRFIGVSAREFLAESGIKIDLIASHGHTVFHAPEKGYTYQIGNGACIAAESGVLTICDFRSLDVARGGQGAPLVPIGDELLFPEYGACLNLGGFSNVSFNNNEGLRMAFDICPVNFVFNRLANKLGFEFDAEGEIAKSGEVIDGLLIELNQNSYYSAAAPKSLGQEWVQKNIFPLFDTNYKIKDVLRTFSEHAAYQIARELNKINNKEVLVTGGGCYNNFLMQLIKDKCSKTLVIPERELINMKEALIFAFLGVLRIRGEINSLASVTGANLDSINGAVYIS